MPDMSSTVIPSDSAELCDSMPGAPSLPGAPAAASLPGPDLLKLSPGQIVLDFQIQRLIGRGAFGSVYLALQLSLQRMVALKVTEDRGTEGRTLAQLEHVNIVQVFSEQTIAGRPLRLLCMQYVAGPTLRRLMDHFRDRGIAGTWNGTEALEYIDQAAGDLARLRPDEFGNRAVLATLGNTEAICFWGYQLAEGLSFAHSSGILHHDVKPANILINLSGAPLLADFNLAQELQPDEGAQAVGGTLYYMAPEQLRWFLSRTAGEEQRRQSPLPGEQQPRDAAPHATVVPGNSVSVADADVSAATTRIDATADVYSLGLVLTELLQGALPLPANESETAAAAAPCEREDLEALLHCRMQPLPIRAPSSASGEAGITTRLVLQRACRPAPSERTASARLLARELRGCLLISEIESRSPHGPCTRVAGRYPFATLLLLAAVPHAVGSLVNIAYNAARVADLGHPTARTGLAPGTVTDTFASLTLWYNLIVWPGCILILTRLILTTRTAVNGALCENAELEESQRHRLLRLPQRLSLVAMLGWLPGLVVFPAGLQILSGIPLQDGLLHFGVNLLMSGSIAFGYSYMGAVWLIITICYLRLWRFPAGLSDAAVRDETCALLKPLAACRVAAGITPLLSAILIIAISPASLGDKQYSIFRALLTVLIAVGILGYQFSARVTSSLTSRVRQTASSTG